MVTVGEDHVSGAGVAVQPSGGYILEMESTGLAGELDIGQEVTSEWKVPGEACYLDEGCPGKSRSSPSGEVTGFALGT